MRPAPPQACVPSSVGASLSIAAAVTRTSWASHVPTFRDANLLAPCRRRRPESGPRAAGLPWAGALALPSPLLSSCLTPPDQTGTQRRGAACQADPGFRSGLGPLQPQELAPLLAGSLTVLWVSWFPWGGHLKFP